MPSAETVSNLRVIAGPARSGAGAGESIDARRDHRVIEGTNAGVWETDLRTGSVWFSARFKALLGLSEATPLDSYKLIYERIHPDDLPHYVRRHKEAAHSLGSFDFEVRVLHVSGDYRWMKGRGRVWPDDSGMPATVVGSVIDIQEQKTAQEALLRMTRRFQRAMAAACEGLFEYRLGSDEAYHSPRVHELLGHEPGELASDAALLRTRLHPEDRERFDVARTDGIAGHGRWQIEYRLACKSGEYRWFRERSSVTPDDDGALLLSGVITDIHDERLAREAVDQAHLAKAQFLANTSHEIRTPLHGVLGMLELLRAASIGEPARRYVDTALRSARNLLAIINDILDFSKIEAGKFALETIAFEPRAVVHEAVELLRPQADGKGLTLSCSVAPAVPLRMRGDPGRIGQVLANLIGNAVKFTDRGQVVLRVDVQPIASGALQALTIGVEDSGIGMAAETIDVLFSPFMQADASMSRRFGGTGLGLAICKQLIDLMGGRVRVDSALGRGSRFQVWIPLPVDAPAHTPVAADASPDRGRAGAGDAARRASAQRRSALGLRVLVAEDNPVNQLVAVQMLRKLGLDACVANDGREALQLCTERGFDLVLMDCQMPVMNGFDALKRIRQPDACIAPLATPQGVTVIAVTGNAFAGDAQRCLDAGFDGYLSKPFDIRQLEELVDHHLKKSPAAQQAPARWPELASLMP